MCVIMALATYGSGEAAAGGWPAPRGPYLGQQPPGDEPQVFAPGLLGTGLFTRDVALTPDGQELYFTVVVGSYDYTAIAGTRVRGGRWTAPEVLPFSGDPAVMDAEPFVTADGKHLFFLSNRPRPGRPAGDRNQDIWVVDRVGERWGGAPRHLGAPVDTDDEEYFPSLTRDGTLYFTRAGKGQPSAIWRARPAAGGFAAPERLPDTVNAGKEHFNAFVAPDESYLLLSITGRPDAIGRSDYYVCFRTPGDAWSAPVNLGPKINVAGGTGYAPYVSPDGRHLFFMSKRLRPELLENGRVSYGRLVQWLGQVETGNPTTYWVAATLLDRLRQAAGSGGPNPP
jgi:hypothetical protein